MPQIPKNYLETYNPSSWIESLSGLNTWTNREVTWLKSNTMFVFGVESKAEMNKWICIINYLIKYTS